MRMDNWRIFDPVLKGFNSWVQPSDIVWYDDEDRVSRIARVGRRSRTPVVMWIDGGCRGNGTDWALAGYGIYFGQGSPYNCYGKLPGTGWVNHTNQAAEIYAARIAVDFQLQNMGDELCQDGVVIVTDSDYLHQAITRHIYKWVDNDFLNAKGVPVTNGAAFSELHNAICEWEDSGILIRFWKVPREQNRDADRLANKALDS